MRKLRIAFVLVLVALVGLSAVAPRASLAQDEQPATGARTLYLPAVRSGSSAGAQTQPVADPNQLVVHKVPASEAAATAKFWTRERMMAATPLDVVTVTAQQAAAIQATAAAQQAAVEQAQGPRGSAPPGMPDPGAAALAQQLYPEEWARMAAEDAAPPELAAGMQAAGVDQLDTYATSPAFVSYYVNNSTLSQTWTAFPSRTMGRLFFRIPSDPNLYACSASVAYGRVVWTAGHCIYTHGKGWSYNMYFVPAYRNGSYPYGSFSVYAMTTTNGWLLNTDPGLSLPYDIGMAAVSDKSGLKLSQWVGSLGFLYNAVASQLFHAFGYPGNYSSGEYLVVCASPKYVRDTLGTPNPIGIGCDMDTGSSGGPWLVGYAPFKTTLSNYINSVVAYRYDGQPNYMYGPYFGTAAKTLFDWAKLQ